MDIHQTKQRIDPSDKKLVTLGNEYNKSKDGVLKPYSPEFMCRKKWKKIEKTSLFFKVTPLVLINKSKKCRCFCSHQMTWVGLSQYSMNLMEVRLWISSELMQGCSSILEFCESKLHRYVSNHSKRMSTKTKTVANIISKTGEKLPP